LIIISIVLLVIIVVLSWFLVTTPRSTVITAATSTPATHTTTQASGTKPSTVPLSASVKVTAPASGASVERTFTVSGVAPNGWYYEAVFPIQIRDGDDNLIASGQGKAQSDWTVSGPVPFSATITVPANFSGPANLILLRDNPSGLPENFDEVTVSIIII
jgi:hypothetical protein